MKDTLNKNIDSIENILPDDDEHKIIIKGVKIEGTFHETAMFTAQATINELKDKDELNFFKQNDMDSL